MYHFLYQLCLYWYTLAIMNVFDWLEAQNNAVIKWMRNTKSPLYLRIAFSVSDSQGKWWWKLWFLKWFSSCTFPQLIHSLNDFASLPIIQERQKRGEFKWAEKTHTVESMRGTRGLGIQWVDWKGFDPLNRSTCSSGISRKHSSILVQRDVGPLALGPNGCLGVKQIPGALICGCGMWEYALQGNAAPGERAAAISVLITSTKGQKNYAFSTWMLFKWRDLTGFRTSRCKCCYVQITITTMCIKPQCSYTD